MIEFHIDFVIKRLGKSMCRMLFDPKRDNEYQRSRVTYLWVPHSYKRSHDTAFMKFMAKTLNGTLS